MARSGDHRMFRTGLLVLTKPIHKLSRNIPQLLSSAFQLVNETLYIHLVPDLLSTPKAALGNIPCTEIVKQFVLNTYVSASTICSGPDVRFLLGNLVNEPATAADQLHPLKSACQVVITHETAQDRQGTLLQYISKNFPTKENIALETVAVTTVYPDQLDYPDSVTASDCDLVTTYDNVAVGGTFDNLHIGHKILLTEACLRTNKGLTVGVTDTCMNRNKVLCELIRPTDSRIKDVLAFVTDIKPSLQYNVEAITDPFGPTQVDVDLQCLVVSEETVQGGQLVNEKRREKGLCSLDVVTIELVEDNCHSANEEAKISSSSLRKRLLGSLLRQPKSNPQLTPLPYIIGLTGGIGSGKSSVCRRLQGQGAAIVDCDKLGHKAYEKGTETLANLVTAFGEEILNASGEIDRKVLGSKVFTDKKELEKLNKIVWPAIAKLAQQEVNVYAKQGKDVVVLDAAVLLEAGWDTMVHEVWTTSVPKVEAVRRVMERNKLSQEEATRRVESQLSNEVRVNHCNVAICTLWEYEVTQKQVEKAWQLLMARLPRAASQQ